MSQRTTGIGIQRTATQRVPTRTVAGSYEAPVEGIVDYGAFQRGFESTFQMPEEDLDIAGQLKEGLKKFDATEYAKWVDTRKSDIVDWDVNEAVYTKLKNNIGELRNQYIADIISGNKENQDKILNKLGVYSSGIDNWNNFLKKASETEIYDIEASDLILHEYKDKNNVVRTITAQDLAKLNKENPNAFEYKMQESEYGNDYLSLNVKYNGQDININLTDLTDAKAEDYFSIKVDTDQLRSDFNKKSPMPKQVPIETKTTFDINGRQVTREAGEITPETDAENIQQSNSFASSVINSASYIEEMPSLLNKAFKQPDMAGFRTSLGQNLDELKNIMTLVQTDEGLKQWTDYVNSGYATAGSSFRLNSDQAKQLLKQQSDEVVYKMLTNDYKRSTGSYKYDTRDGEYKVASELLGVTTKPIDEKGEGIVFNFGGSNYDIPQDLLQTTKNLLARTASNNPEDIKRSAVGRSLSIPDIGNVLLSDKDVNVTFNKVTKGPDKGQTKPQIDLKFKATDPSGEETEVLETFDFRKEGDIEKYMSYIFGFGSEKSKKWKDLYKPTLAYIKQERRAKENQRPNLP